MKTRKTYLVSVLKLLRIITIFSWPLISDTNVLPDSDALQPDEQATDIDLTESKLGYEPETSDTNPSSNINRSKRKRDSPRVLADDDLIRDWCQMQCTKCPKLFKEYTFKDVKIHYSKEHSMNGFLQCCHKKFFRRVRALEHIARHINPKEFR